MLNIKSSDELHTFECLVFMPWRGQMRFRIVRSEGVSGQAILLSDKKYDERLFKVLDHLGITEFTEMGNHRPVTMSEFIHVQQEESIPKEFPALEHRTDKGSVLKAIEAGEYQVPYSDKGFSVSYIRNWEKDVWSNICEIPNPKIKFKYIGKTDEAYISTMIMIKVDNKPFHPSKIVANLNFINDHKELYIIPENFTMPELHWGCNSINKYTTMVTNGKTCVTFDEAIEKLYHELIAVAFK